MVKLLYTIPRKGPFINLDGLRRRLCNRGVNGQKGEQTQCIKCPQKMSNAWLFGWPLTYSFSMYRRDNLANLCLVSSSQMLELNLLVWGTKKPPRNNDKHQGKIILGTVLFVVYLWLCYANEPQPQFGSRRILASRREWVRGRNQGHTTC